MKPDFVYGTAYQILQPAGMYHMNSDTEFLGRFLRIKHHDSVLDIGCGTGALMLYAASFQPQKLSGIDLFPAVIEAAENNLQRNHLAADFYTGMVQNLSAGPFDCILCNPPFFRTAGSSHAENRYLRAARHEEFLTETDLFRAVKRLLKDNGRFFLVQRAVRCSEILTLAESFGLRPVRLQFSYRSPADSAVCFAAEFRFGRQPNVTVEAPVFLDRLHELPAIDV